MMRKVSDPLLNWNLR